MTYLSRVGPQKEVVIRSGYCSLLCRGYSKVAAAAELPIAGDSGEKGHANTPEVNLNKMFWAKPCSLALAADSPLRVEEPKYEGIRHIIFKLLLFYSKQSKSIGGQMWFTVVLFHKLINLLSIMYLAWRRPSK